MLFQNVSRTSIATIAYTNNHVERDNLCLEDDCLDLSTTSFSNPPNGDTVHKPEVHRV